MSMASVFAAANLPSTRPGSTSGLSEASSSLFTHAARRTPFPKSDIEIHITNHYKTKTYTSGSRIAGTVTITTQRDVRFDAVEIILLGGAKSRTEGYRAPHESTHTFLKLTMPVPDAAYPVPRVLDAGRTLTLPFHFVLPAFLTLSACHHRVDADPVRAQHLRLPPSMGSWARGNWEKDDLAPTMADVVYSLKARVWREPDLPRGRPVKVMETVKAIQVIPAAAEDPPLTISPTDMLYKTSSTKTLRKNILAAKLGTLTVSAHQPRAITLRPDGSVAAPSAAHLDLTFTPLTADAQPPRIAAVAARLAAHTYYSAAPAPNLPSTGNFMRAGLTERRGLYSTSVNLPSAATAAAAKATQPAWAAHSFRRRDSGYGSDESGCAASPTSGCSDEEQQQQQQQQQQPLARRRKSSSLASLIRPSRSPTPRSSGPGLVQTSTTLTVPLTLPTAKKTFVPTFHSCIVSRVYTLHVSVTVDAAAAAAGMGAGPAAMTKLSLDLPVQIAVDGAGAGAGAGASEDGGREGEPLPSFAEAVEAAAADAFLRPRVFGSLAGEGDGDGDGDGYGDGALPGYERRG